MHILPYKLFHQFISIHRHQFQFNSNSFQYLIFQFQFNSNSQVFSINSNSIHNWPQPFYHDPQALGTDAFLQNWDGYQVYAFPPWSLIPLFLKKLWSSSGVLMTLVALWWPQRPWFPELLDLTVDGRVQLPQCQDLLRQPHFHRHHLGISRLFLHVRRLSSDLPDRRGSPLV